jgi:hypothetical protein
MALIGVRDAAPAIFPVQGPGIEILNSWLAVSQFVVALKGRGENFNRHIQVGTP